MSGLSPQGTAAVVSTAVLHVYPYRADTITDEGNCNLLISSKRKNKRLGFDVFQGAYSLIPKMFHFVVENWIKASNSSLFQHRSVKELLWGYPDPMLKQLMGLFVPVSKHILWLYT